MSFEVLQRGDPEWVVPYVIGLERLDGVHVQDLSGMDVLDILIFCEKEGWRKGWNDANQKHVGQNEDSPFHHELLGGFPDAEWIRSYHRGVQDWSNALVQETGVRRCPVTAGQVGI